MAWNQLVAVKRNLVRELAKVIPASDESGNPVAGIDYSWPGKMQLDEHIWFYGGEHSIDDPVVKAGRRWRDVTSSFDLVIEVRRTGQTIDSDDRITLQADCDERCDYLLGLCDQWIADNPHLGFGPDPDAVDNDFVITGSLIEAVRFEHGPIDRGCAALNVARVTYYARIK